MDTREEVAAFMAKASARLFASVETPTAQDELLTAIVRYLNVIDGDLQKLRKELRTRNGIETND